MEKKTDERWRGFSGFKGKTRMRTEKGKRHEYSSTPTSPPKEEEKRVLDEENERATSCNREKGKNYPVDKEGTNG